MNRPETDLDDTEEIVNALDASNSEAFETPMNAIAIGNKRISRRTFVHSGIVSLSGLALAGCVNGITTRGDIEVTHRVLTVPNLPQSFKGATITLLSDIHSSPYMGLEDLRKIATIVNGLKSDIILMPGDFVTSHHNEIPPFVEAMSELSAPMGVFASTGNHDYYCGADEVCSALDDIGITVLRNENIKLKKPDGELTIIGVDDDDASTIKDHVSGGIAPHIDEAFRGVSERSASILLCHKPYDFESFAKMNVGLMLSGHTHGGQIVFGRIGRSVLSISSIASHFIEGEYHADNSKLYVSRGLGVVGVPIRINCPPEITQITLA